MSEDQKQKDITQEDLKLFQKAFNASKKVQQIKEDDTSKKKRNIIIVSISSFLLIILISIGTYLYLNREIPPSYIEVIRNIKTNHFEISELNTPSDFEELVIESNLDDLDSLVILAYNPNTTQEYYSKDIDKQVQIASITKLMSVLVALEEYELETVVEVPQLPDYLEYGFGLKQGDTISIENLIHTMLLSSYNDSAYVLGAVYPQTGYEGFIELMNIKAQKIGMSNTSFANTMGFDNEENFSTANDLKKLVAIVLNNSYMMSIVQNTSYVVEYTSLEEGLITTTIYSTNDLLSTNVLAKGLKTGYTKDAGLCLIGYFDAGEGDELITIVLNAGDRFAETEQLLELIRVSYSN